MYKSASTTKQWQTIVCTSTLLDNCFTLFMTVYTSYYTVIVPVHNALTPALPDLETEREKQKQIKT